MLVAWGEVHVPTSFTSLWMQVSGPANMYQLTSGERLELHIPPHNEGQLRKKNYDTFGMNMAGGQYSNWANRELVVTSLE